MDQGRTVKYLRVNRREIEEAEDLDEDSCTMWRRM
jgi:hypothetical protein